MSYRTVFSPVLVTQVYPDILKSSLHDMLLAELLWLNRLQTLQCCAYLNSQVARHHAPLLGVSQQIPLIKMFVSESKLSRVLRNVDVLKVQNVYQLKPTFFHRHQLLELMRYVTLHCPGEGRNPTQDNHGKRCFLRAALIVSEMIADITYEHVNPEATPDVLKQTMLEPIRQSARFTSHARDFIVEMYRGGSIFLDYLPKQSQDFLNAFERETGLTVYEYYGCLAFVESHYGYLGQRDYKRQVISEHRYGQDANIMRIMKHYLALESYSVDELKDAFTNNRSQHRLKPLIEKPILRFNDEAATVLDPALHTAKAGIGPLFAVPRQIGKLLSAFGYAFEEYAQEILRHLCTNSGNDIHNLKFNQLLQGKQKGEIDACLVEDTNLLLFEIKGGWIKDNRQIASDHSIYLSDLYDKYGDSAKQLARAIVELITHPLEAKIDSHNIIKSQKIFPILLAYDTSLVLPGYTQYFEAEFAQELGTSGLATVNRRVFTIAQWEIAPLTVITIDVLEMLEESVKSFSLANLLADYAKHRHKSPYDNEDTSLAEFIQWSGYQKKIRGSERIKGKSIQFVREIFRTILPQQMNTELLDDLSK